MDDLNIRGHGATNMVDRYQNVTKSLKIDTKTNLGVLSGSTGSPPDGKWDYFVTGWELQIQIKAKQILEQNNYSSVLGNHKAMTNHSILYYTTRF